MNTQMNPTDAEIIGMIDGMECGDYGVKRIASTGPEILVSLEDLLATDNGANHFVTFYPSELLAFCRAVVSKVDDPAKPTDIERIIYALQLWMKRIEQGIPLQQNMQIGGWETRWNRMKKVIEDWKTKGEMPK